MSSISQCFSSAWRLLLINTVWQSHPIARRREISAAGYSAGWTRLITVSGAGRGILGGRGSSRWGLKSNTGSSPFGACLFSFGWSTSAVVLIEFIGCGETPRYSLPPKSGWRVRLSSPKHRVAILESTAIDDPVTVGLFHPAILLPSKVLPDLNELDLSAIIAHEYGHIRRKDFLAHVLCELISLPVAWHPGIRYLMSKISQTRELACDDYAAVRLGKRRLYARTLLRLASLCLHVPRGNAVGLGIFDGENLETRIMMLTEKRLSLSRAGVIGLALATSITFGAGAVLAHAMSLQVGSVSSNTAETFAGTWHWMFNGKSFSTMILVRDGSGFTGTVTPSRIALNHEGGLMRADPSENSTPSPITKANLEGSALHVTVGDGNEPIEFIVTLKDETHAEIHPKGAPPNMQPIPAEKVH